MLPFTYTDFREVESEDLGQTKSNGIKSRFMQAVTFKYKKFLIEIMKLGRKEDKSKLSINRISTNIRIL